MTDHRAAYAHRFVARAIVRPPRPPTRMTVAEFEAWLIDKPEWARELHRACRELGRSIAALRLAWDAQDWPDLRNPATTSPSPRTLPPRPVTWIMRPLP